MESLIIETPSFGNLFLSRLMLSRLRLRLLALFSQLMRQSETPNQSRRNNRGESRSLCPLLAEENDVFVYNCQ